jgi:hypothetical protein
MFGRIAISFVVLAGLASAGCPGASDGESPEAACNEQQANLCERVYACLTPAELALAGLPDSEAACTQRLQDVKGCARQTRSNVCVGNARYHADQAERCAEQITGLACSQVRDDLELEDVAPACGKICVID